MKMKSQTRASGHWRKRVSAARWLACAALLTPGLVFAVQPGDTEPNEAVDLRDLLAIRNAFGDSGSPGFTGADIDSNGVVNNADLLIWRQNFPFIGSPLAPYLFIANPLDGSLIGDRRPNVVIDYGATTLNVDPATLQVVVDGQDRSAEAVKSFTNAILPVEEAFGDGPHFVEVSIEDTQGTVAMARSDFDVTSLTLMPRAVPMSGPAPLTPTFYPDVIWADSPPSHYLWDWDNNGTWDNGCIGCFDASARPDQLQQTFNEEGVHTIRFGVYRGATGITTETTLDIAVTQTFASVSPSNGTFPLTVFLHGIAADLSDPIEEYEWDYNYTGVFTADFSSTTSANTAHVYTTPGVYEPRFRTKHASGAIVEHPIVQQQVHVQNFGAPTAVAAAAQGVDALTVNFAGNGSDTGGIALYEWDFDNDGVWDYSSPTSGTVSHTYPTAGVKIAALRVTDTDTNTAIDRVRFETFAPAELEVLDDTVEPAASELVTIRTELTIESDVVLFIKSKQGRVIRTLVDHEIRPEGIYEDTWDGRDFRGEPAHPDDYYAVLQYSYPGRTDTLDLTDTTGGNHYFAPRLTSNPSSFDPFEDDFWTMTFSIPSASRASLYILPGGSNRTATPFDELPLGAGEYTYYWAGLRSDGTLAPITSHLWSVNAWTLGDNAIIVKGDPEISELDVSPNLYSPSDRVPLNAGVSLNFELSTSSAVLAKLINIENQVTLRSWQTGFMPAGLQEILWDGRAQGGEYLSPGDYRFSIRAVSEKGNVSLEREALLRVGY